MRTQKLNCTSVPPFDYSSITPSLSHSIPKRKIADYSILLSEVLSVQKHHGRHGTSSWRGTKLLSEVLSECVCGRTVKKNNQPKPS
ncbi:unnamed protein product [Ectocarpus sp. CCAP 1310/34]|nr:unnamed protein product [Ectocarpus sp. CCAP 1310/34]